MDLENYLLKNSKEEEISLIVKSLGDAAIEISNNLFQSEISIWQLFSKDPQLPYGL